VLLLTLDILVVLYVNPEIRFFRGSRGGFEGERGSGMDGPDALRKMPTVKPPNHVGNIHLSGQCLAAPWDNNSVAVESSFRISTLPFNILLLIFSKIKL
jgi:hypothetical protein